MSLLIDGRDITKTKLGVIMSIYLVVMMITEMWGLVPGVALLVAYLTPAMYRVVTVELIHRKRMKEVRKHLANKNKPIN